MSDSNAIILLKRKSDDRIVLFSEIKKKPQLLDLGLYKEECCIIEVKDLFNRLRIENAIYYLTKDRHIRKSLYDQLTIACSKEEINTRKLTHEECREIIFDTHRFIHDILEINDFTITDDIGKHHENFIWSENGKIFINKKMIK